MNSRLLPFLKTLEKESADIEFLGLSINEPIEKYRLHGGEQSQSNPTMYAVNPCRVSKTFDDAALREVIDTISNRLSLRAILSGVFSLRSHSLVSMSPSIRATFGLVLCLIVYVSDHIPAPPNFTKRLG